MVKREFRLFFLQKGANSGAVGMLKTNRRKS